MPSAMISVTALLVGIGILLIGNGLLAVDLVLRAEAQGSSESAIGMVMAGYFVGFIAGTFLCPLVIRAVGHIRTFTAMAALAAIASVAFVAWSHPLWWWMLRVTVGFSLVGI